MWLKSRRTQNTDYGVHYEKEIHEIDKVAIYRQYDYDSYVDGYLEDEYKRKVKEKEDKINNIYRIIDSL